jgi:integrase
MTNRSHEQTARQREQLLSFESVKRWMGRETIKSKKTRIGYLDHLQVLLDRLGCNPDELVAQRIEDMGQQEFTKRERLEQRIREFRQELSKGSEGKAFMVVAAACSFLKANTGARLNINNPLPEVRYEAWMYEGEPGREQDFWRNIVDHAPTVRDAAVFLIGLEAGPRDGSVLAMTIGDVASEFGTHAAPYKICIPPPGESPKRKRGGYGFIAEDARRKIDTYLALRKARGFTVEMSDPLTVDLETGERLKDSHMLNDALRHAFLDAGALSHDQVYPPDVRMSPVRWYCLRKRVQTIMEDNTDGTGIALNWVDELLSHRKRGAQAGHYSKPTVQQLRGAYAKAMHRLMIYHEARPQVGQDQINLTVQRALQEAIGDKLAREFEKMRSQTVTGAEIARLLRQLITVSKEAE